MPSVFPLKAEARVDLAALDRVLLGLLLLRPRPPERPRPLLLWLEPSCGGRSRLDAPVPVFTVDPMTELLMVR